MTAAILPFPSQIKKKPSRPAARFFANKQAETHAQLGAEVKAMFDAIKAMEEELAAEVERRLAAPMGLPV